MQVYVKLVDAEHYVAAIDEPASKNSLRKIPIKNSAPSVCASAALRVGVLAQSPPPLYAILGKDS